MCYELVNIFAELVCFILSLAKGNSTDQEMKVKDTHFIALQFFWSPIREPMASLAANFPKTLVSVPRITHRQIPSGMNNHVPFLLKHASKEL